MIDRVSPAWLTLRRQIEIRCAELQEEVRSYPTPIARCDVQLTKLLEDRQAAYERLRAAGELDRMRTTLSRRAWQAGLRRLARGMVATQDKELAAACQGLMDAVGSRP